MDLGGMEKEKVEVQQAYEVVKRIDVLNVSVEVGFPLKTRTMSMSRGWKTELLRGCVICLGLRNANEFGTLFESR